MKFFKMNWKAIKFNCNKQKHRFRDNKFGITWCTLCGLLSKKPSNKPLQKIELWQQ